MDRRRPQPFPRLADTNMTGPEHRLALHLTEVLDRVTTNIQGVPMVVVHFTLKYNDGRELVIDAVPEALLQHGDGA